MFALWLLTVDFQRGGAGPLTLYGAILLFVGGRFFTDAAPQIVPSWWIVLVVVLSVRGVLRVRDEHGGHDHGSPLPQSAVSI